MAGNGNQKLKLLYLLQILESETDEENPIKTADILRRLSDLGIVAERKSIYRDIDCLREAGYDIVSASGGGYFLGERRFELSEVKLLTDEVQAPSFITHQKSFKLIEKLKGLVSKSDARSIDRQLHMSGISKAENEQIYYVIDAIYDAISKDRQISFKYLDYTLSGEKHYRSDGKEYSVSPYALVWDNEYYYLAAYYKKHHKIANFRVDKMDRVRVIDSKREKSDEYKHFDPAKKAKSQFSMFGGEPELITAQIEDKYIGVFVDRFGDDLTLEKGKNGYSRVRFKAEVSRTFMSWIFQFGEGVRILSPKKVCDGVADMLTRVLKMYGENDD